MSNARISTLVIHLRATFSCVGCIVTGVLVGWFPHWRSAPSLVKFTRLGVPWSAVGVAFLIAAVLIAFPRFRAYGYGLGSVLYLTAAWSLWTVAPDATAANAPATAGLTMTGLFLLCGVATAQQDRGRRDAT